MGFRRKQVFGKILSEYLNDNLPAEKLDEAIKLILREENRRLLEDIAERKLREKPGVVAAGRDEIDRKFSLLMEEARSYDERKNGSAETFKEKSTRVVPFWRRIAAAAAILLIVALGATLITGRFTARNPGNDIAGNVMQDLTPGSEKAILTLADGSTVMLDTASEGVLATQSRTNILKLADGRILYEQAGRETSKVLYNTISTPRGGEYSVILPDSSRVWLNAESSIKFPVQFAGNERRVEVTGEVYFEVVRDRSMPFRVITGNTITEVLGTSFNVRAYYGEEGVSTTLVEGSVKVVSAGESRHVAPGQRATTDSNGIITIEDDVDIEEIIAWKNGVFLFNSESLDEIMNQIGRWYNVKIEYHGDLKTKTFSGIVSRKSNVSQVLSLMEPYGIKFTITDETILVEAED